MSLGTEQTVVFIGTPETTLGTEQTVTFLGAPESSLGAEQTAVLTGFPIVIIPPVIQSVSVVQRDVNISYLADITFVTYDPNSTSLAALIEYSLDSGLTWFPTTQQPFDRKDSFSNPISGVPASAPGKSVNFVWNAFEDLPDGIFSLAVRVTVDDGTTQISLVSALVDIATTTKANISQSGLQGQLDRARSLARTPLDFLGNGLITPFGRAASDLRAGRGAELVRSSVRQILGTRAAVNGMPGELPWRPTFGFKMWALKHKSNNSALSDVILAYVQDALLQEPRAEAISATIIESQDNTKFVRVSYSVISANVSGNQVDTPIFEEDIPVLG